MAATLAATAIAARFTGDFTPSWSFAENATLTACSHSFRAYCSTDAGYPTIGLTFGESNRRRGRRDGGLPERRAVISSGRASRGNGTSAAGSPVWPHADDPGRPAVHSPA